MSVLSSKTAILDTLKVRLFWFPVKFFQKINFGAGQEAFQKPKFWEMLIIVALISKNSVK
jgi:hypothetical protein